MIEIIIQTVIGSVYIFAIFMGIWWAISKFLNRTDWEREVYKERNRIFDLKEDLYNARMEISKLKIVIEKEKISKDINIKIAIEEDRSKVLKNLKKLKEDDELYNGIFGDEKE